MLHIKFPSPNSGSHIKIAASAASLREPCTAQFGSAANCCVRVVSLKAVRAIYKSGAIFNDIHPSLQGEFWLSPQLPHCIPTCSSGSPIVRYPWLTAREQGFIEICSLASSICLSNHFFVFRTQPAALPNEMSEDVII